MQKLYERLQYTFQNEALLREALTHASCDAGYSYERLEFLGDAVLELEVSAWLYRQHPDFREGQLSAMRTRLVQEEHLSAWARAAARARSTRSRRLRARLCSAYAAGRGERFSVLREKCEKVVDFSSDTRYNNFCWYRNATVAE